MVEASRTITDSAVPAVARWLETHRPKRVLAYAVGHAFLQESDVLPTLEYDLSGTLIRCVLLWLLGLSVSDAVYLERFLVESSLTCF